MQTIPFLFINFIDFNRTTEWLEFEHAIMCYADTRPQIEL